MKNTKLTRFVLSAIVLLSAGAAVAGTRWTYPLSIYKNSDGSGSVSGSLADVRNSPSQSYIGCDVSTSYVSCSAYDATNYNYMNCFSSQPAFVSLAATINTGTELAFNVDAHGNCTWMRVSNWSALSVSAP
jgi:hypothetical protein